MTADGRRGLGIFPAALLLFAFVDPPALAVTKPFRAEDVEIGTCIRRASGGRLWLEKTLWGLRDQEAGWIGAEVANSNGTHDLGPLQVNSWWVERIAALTRRPARDIRDWLISDACFNVDVARWIFLSALSETRDYWKAVGLYHSPTPWRQQRYTTMVVVKLRRRFGAQVFGARATAPRAIIRPQSLSIVASPATSADVADGRR